jgi:hypothetical protein
MKNAAIFFLLVWAPVTASAQMDNPLKEGMPNTVTLPSGEVVYDLNGEWDAHFDNGPLGTNKDIFKITQKNNNFEGILLTGSQWVPKGTASIKGLLERNGFKSLERLTGEGLSAATGEISEKGNKIVVKTPIKTYGFTQVLTLTRK